MHSFFSLRRTFFSGILFLVFFSGCTRITSTELGAGLLPPVDGVTTMDTLVDVITDNFNDPDSMRIYKSNNQVLGAITFDPLFGKTQASMYFEMKPAGYPFKPAGVKDSLVIDSAVLILSYHGSYGDSTAPLRLHVFEIDNTTPLQHAVNYASNYPSVFPVKLGAEIATPATVNIRRLSDSVNNRFENSVNQLRIRLNNSIATRFLKTYDSSNAYLSDSAFRTYFAGFGLTADASGPANALLKFNLNDTNSKFALYYSTSSTGATRRDTSVSYFKFNITTCGNANIITRDRSGSEMANHLTTTSKPDSLVYVQTSPGSYVRIKIPGLQNLSNRIIHRAELIMEQVPDDARLSTTETQMRPPRFLFLSHYDSSINSRRNIPNDFFVGSNGPNTMGFGGYVAYKSINGYDRVAAYTFDLSRYVQGIVTRKDTSFTLRLSAPVNDSLRYTPPYPGNTSSQLYYLDPSITNDPADGRVRLGGGTHSRFRMRLRIIYSRI